MTRERKARARTKSGSPSAACRSLMPSRWGRLSSARSLSPRSLSPDPALAKGGAVGGGVAVGALAGMVGRGGQGGAAHGVRGLGGGPGGCGWHVCGGGEAA